jgi:hypothetical protein
VVLLGIATLGSAWCGYQATRWNGEGTDLARTAAEVGFDAAREFGLATQLVTYDSNMVAQYAQAFAAEDEGLVQFFRETLIREEFLPVLDDWEASIAGGETPVNLLADTDYLDSQFSDYRTTQAAAQDYNQQAEAAGDTTDDYVLTTVLLASAVFFAGLTSSFRVRFAQLLLLTGSSVLIAYAAVKLSDLPVV